MQLHKSFNHQEKTLVFKYKFLKSNNKFYMSWSKCSSAAICERYLSEYAPIARKFFTYYLFNKYFIIEHFLNPWISTVIWIIEEYVTRFWANSDLSVRLQIHETQLKLYHVDIF